jgi:hypothetical protein
MARNDRGASTLGTFGTLGTPDSFLFVLKEVKEWQYKIYTSTFADI